MRRADMVDRGRRLFPKNGKFGKVKLVSGSNTLYVNSLTDPGTAQTWEMSDGTTCVANTFTHTFTPNSPPNSGTCWLSEPMTYLNLVNGATDLISIEIDRKLSNLTTLLARSNFNLESIQMHSTWTSINTIEIWSCKLSGTLPTHSTWTELKTFVFHSNYPISGNITACPTHNSWTKLETLSGYNNNYLSDCELQQGWSSIKTIWLSTTRLGPTVNTYNDWTTIEYLNLSSVQGGGLTSFETHNGWTNLATLALNINSINSIELHDTWSSLTTLYFNQNSGISITWPATGLTALDTVFAYACGWNGTEIDDMVIALDDYGVNNGELRYNGNPNSADSNRSSTANTALANLVTKGWTIFK